MCGIAMLWDDAFHAIMRISWFVSDIQILKVFSEKTFGIVGMERVSVYNKRRIS